MSGQGCGRLWKYDPSEQFRNHYMIERTRRILRRTVWALQEQLKNGKFKPEGFEVSIGGGRIDRLDTLKEDNRVYVKIIDYKTGNTSFDLVEVFIMDCSCSWWSIWMRPCRQKRGSTRSVK